METPQIEQERRLKENLSLIKKKFLVLSGKGGVGKSTVAVNLAYALAEKGYQVGILDTDLHGPNVAKMLGVEARRLSQDDSGLEPCHVLPNLKAVSMAFFLESPDNPVIWRGPMKMAAIKQFLSDIHWGELDYLIIDSPPGTGDEPLSTCQLIPGIDGAVIITTPQAVAVLDSRKTVGFARQLNIPIVGIVENMSGFSCPHCGEEVSLFSRDGGRQAAGELQVPFLGQIPFDPGMVACGDSGEPYIRQAAKTESGKKMSKIIESIISF